MIYARLIDYFRRFFFFSCVHSMTWRRFNWRVVEMLEGDLELQTTSFSWLAINWKIPNQDKKWFEITISIH